MTDYYEPQRPVTRNSDGSIVSQRPAGIVARDAKGNVIHPVGVETVKSGYFATNCENLPSDMLCRTADKNEEHKAGDLPVGTKVIYYAYGNPMGDLRAQNAGDVHPEAVVVSPDGSQHVAKEMATDAEVAVVKIPEPIVVVEVAKPAAEKRDDRFDGYDDRRDRT